MGPVVSSLSPINCELALLSGMQQAFSWKTSDLVFVDEDMVFESICITRDQLTRIYHAAVQDLNPNRDEEKCHREFGWWYQQLLKLGIRHAVTDISDPFIVWDSDLIPMKKWPLCERGASGEKVFKIAVLQEASRSGFNSGTTCTARYGRS